MAGRVWLLVLGGALLLAIVPSVVYVSTVTRRPLAWGEGGAPWVVRLAAFGSFTLGQLWVPWVLLPMFYGILILIFLLGSGTTTGLLFFLMGIGSLLQLILSYQLFSLGIRLLCRDPGAAESARRLSRRALWQGVFILSLVALGVGGTLPKLPPWLPPWVGSIIRYTFMFCLSLPTLHALGGLIQAWLLRLSLRDLQGAALRTQSGAT